MTVDSNELEITTEGPQSYLERAAASVEKTLDAEVHEEEESAPKSEPGHKQEPVAGTIEAKGEQPAVDPYEDLERKIAERQARRTKEAEPTETAQLRQKIAEMEAKLNERQGDKHAQMLAELARQGRWVELAEAAGHDPLKAYDGFTNEAADRAKTAAERRIAALEAKLEAADKERTERAERDAREAQQRQVAEAQNRAIQGFIAFSDESADKFPHLAALDPSDRAREGVYFAQRLEAAGEEVTYERVAQIIEARYKRLYSRIGAPKGAQSASRNVADAGGPKTITNDLAAQSSGSDDRPIGRHEYLSKAVNAVRRAQQKQG